MRAKHGTASPAASAGSHRSWTAGEASERISATMAGSWTYRVRVPSALANSSAMIPTCTNVAPMPPSRSGTRAPGCRVQRASDGVHHRSDRPSSTSRCGVRSRRGRTAGWSRAGVHVRRRIACREATGHRPGEEEWS